MHRRTVMAKYIYKIDKDNKTASLKAIERLHPFVGNISEMYKETTVYYVRVCTDSEIFGYGTDSTESRQLYKDYISNEGYEPRSITLDCISIGDIL